MTKSSLGIEAIFVRGIAQPIRTDNYLSALSDIEWTELRALSTRSRRSGDPVLLCGDCRGPVYVRESPVGRRHCYHFGTDTKECRWATANASDFRSIDAFKFGGNQEGDLHRRLKSMVCEIIMLESVTAEAGVAPERYTKGANGEYAFPDVFASSWQGGPAAFEIQLATTQLPTIIRREDFYSENGVRLCWIVDGNFEQRERRAFKDIYLRNAGQVLGVDDEVLEAARSVKAPRFRLWRLLPGPISEGFCPIWRDRIVTPEEIDWGAKGDRPRSVGPGYDAYLDRLVERDEGLRGLRESFYRSLANCEDDRAGMIWDDIVTIVGGSRWDTLGAPYDTVRALGVLATIRRGQVTVRTPIEFSNLPHIVNSFLLEPKNRRIWSKELEVTTRAWIPDLLEVPSIAKKLKRNLVENVGAKKQGVQAGAVFDVLFPEGAFQRLRLQFLSANRR